MNTRHHSPFTTLPPAGLIAGTAPSLRVPVTAGNRGLLRWLRNAELSAWQAADARHDRPGRPLPRRFFRLQAG